MVGCWLFYNLQKSRYLFYKKSNRFGQTFWAWNTSCQQSIEKPAKNHLKTGNLFLTMEVHMAPNPASPAHFGPDFRPGCQENTPGGRGATRWPDLQKNVQDFGVQKLGPKPKSRIFPGNVRNVHGIIFSLLGNYLGPLKIQLSNYLFFYLYMGPWPYRPF